MQNLQMSLEAEKLIEAIVVGLLILWRVKRGFRNGILKEIVNILSGCISLACLVVVFFLVSSILTKAMSTLTVCILALVFLGILFKICNLIFKPILAVGGVSVIGGVNKFLGAVLGAVEALAIAYVMYRFIIYFDIYPLTGFKSLVTL